MSSRRLYVWSGNLQGVEVHASTPEDAVVQAVQANLPCVLNAVIRISLKPRGAHPLDVYIEAPYEEKFPELFTGEFDVQVAAVEKEY